MDLLPLVTRVLDGDEERAIKTLANLFMSIRFSLDRFQYEHVRTAVPDADEWARRAASGSATRTGELFTLITPEALGQRLRDLGLTGEQIDAIGQTVAEVIRPSLPDDVCEALTARIPILAASATS